MERRAYEITELRVQRGDGQGVKVGGYAALFNSESVDLGGFTERIAPGAFAGSLGRDVRALLNHNPDLLLGRTKSGTLRLAEDTRGLGFELDLPETQLGRDTAALIERRDLSGMSFAFRTLKDTWAKVGPGKWMRTLLDLELIDVSPVTFPAYPETEVGLRSADAGDALAGLAAAQAEEEARLRRLRLHERELQ